MRKESFYMPVLSALTLFGLIHAPAVRAIEIQGVAIHAFSSQFQSGADQRFAGFVVDNRGLYGESHVATPSRSMWLTLPADGPVSDAFIEFDLGAVHTLDHMRVWNYNEQPSGANILTRRGIQTADILVAGEDQIFTTHIAGQVFTRAPGTFSDFAQTINLSGVAARYVRINVLTNFGEGDNRVGLSEVRFYDLSLPPVLVSAERRYSNQQVTVRFSEAVSEATATIAANYTIASGINSIDVLSAAMGSYPNLVVLNTAALDPGEVYTLTVQNVRDALGTNPVAANSEVTLGSELKLWLKADSGVAVDEFGFVTQWDDQSGHANHVLQPEEANRPTLDSGAINGQPAIRFDGADDFLEVAHNPSLVFLQDMTVYAVIKPDDYANHNAIVAKTTVNIPAPFDFYLLANAGRPRFIRGGGVPASGLITIEGPLSPPAGEPHVVGASVQFTQGTQYLDGRVNGTAPLLAALADGGTGLRVGSRENLETRMKGEIAEVLIFNSSLATEDRIAVEFYLGAKYGIEITVLAITRHPESVAVLQNRTAAFSVDVTANTTEISYQWQKNNVNIEDATNAVYTTPPTTLEDDNATYRVIVTIPGSSQTSEAATLTVLQDFEPPMVVSIGRDLTDSTRIVVLFDEEVSAATANNIAHYTLSEGSVTGALLGDDGRSVVLTVAGASAEATLGISGIQDLFGNTIQPVDGLAVGAYPFGLAMWYRADAGVTLSGGDLVSEWADHSGHGNHGFQFTEDSMPLKVDGAINGLPVLRFDGVDDYLVVNHSESVAITGDMTIYAVARFNDFANFNGIVGKTAGPANNLPAPFDFYTLQGSGLPRFFRGNGEGIHSQVSGMIAPTPGQDHILSVIMTGTNVSHYLDGEPNGSGALATTIADAGGPMGIGTRMDLVTKMKGDFAEILIFSAGLSEADRLTVNAYLGAKYGIGLPPVSLAAGLSGGNVIISWPDVAGFVLESAGTLPSESWTEVTAEIEIVEGRRQVTIPAGAAQGYYRLIKP